MLKSITDDLVADLDGLTFGPPVTHVYNPLVYARAPWDLYCEKYGQGQRDVVLWGMNPGPFGMAQVGVPFGEVNLARDWLGVEATVGKPPIEHPRRPVEGFACKRSEVSGARLWGWARETSGTAEAFFERFFVATWCPLAFMEASGANRVPEKLPRAEREVLFAACDRAMFRTVEHFKPRFVVGVGRFAEDRLRAVLEGSRIEVIIGGVPHPSPASPQGNAGWSPLASRALRDLGVLGP